MNTIYYVLQKMLKSHIEWLKDSINTHLHNKHNQDKEFRLMENQATQPIYKLKVNKKEYDNYTKDLENNIDIILDLLFKESKERLQDNNFSYLFDKPKNISDIRDRLCDIMRDRYNSRPEIYTTSVLLEAVDMGLIPDPNLFSTEFDESYKILLNYIESDLIQIEKNYNDESQNNDENKLFTVNPNVEELLESTKKSLLESDLIRANISQYSEKMLEDVNAGHWDLWEEIKGSDKYIQIEKPLYARNPKTSIIDGVVGIDFGTKSTVVVTQKDSNYSMPMRIGASDISKQAKSSDYENPTIVQFMRINKFLEDYRERSGRPYTEWNDINVSHSAFNALTEGATGDDYNSFVTNLKKWAGTSSIKLKIIDQKDQTIVDLPPYLELTEEDIDPIEIYAYYLGLNINNMHNGIYLNYYLSFPVNYEAKVRQQILKSFQKGIKKSLPNALVENKDQIADLTIEQGTSEPAAYAITALKAYGFDPEDDESYFYGVFDFGGGTTDFDFGIWRGADENKRSEVRSDYVIEHFGAGGDKYLGGENLLELLAYEVFKNNEETLRKENISFTKPAECREFPGSETLISNSREANINTKKLMEVLRPFWENPDDTRDNYEDSLTVDLFKNNGEKLPNTELDCTSEMLLAILTDRIEDGVKNFFEALRESYENSSHITSDKTHKINIFLAGNSARSNILKDLFSQYITKTVEDMKAHNDKFTEYPEELFEVFPPLGTNDSYEKLEKLGIKYNKNALDSPTGKTGVAFGLIESRRGSTIKVIDHNMKKIDNDTDESDISFKYYLGRNRKSKFKIVLDRKYVYHKWVKFTIADEENVEIFFTDVPMATTNQLEIPNMNVRVKRIKLITTNEDADVYIRITAPTSIEYVVATEDGIKEDNLLCEPQLIDFAE